MVAPAREERPGLLARLDKAAAKRAPKGKREEKSQARFFSQGSIFALTNAHYDGALLHGNPYNVDSTEISVRFPAMLGRWAPLPSTLLLSYKSTFFLFVLHVHAIVPEDFHAPSCQRKNAETELRRSNPK